MVSREACPQYGSTWFKRNGHIHTGKQNHRCKLCGRPRAVYQKFGICRICFRKLADQGMIPGVRNASW